MIQATVIILQMIIFAQSMMMTVLGLQLAKLESNESLTLIYISLVTWVTSESYNLYKNILTIINKKSAEKCLKVVKKGYIFE